MCYHVRAAGRGVLLPDADGYTTEPAKRKMQVLSLLKKINKYFKFNFAFEFFAFDSYLKASGPQNYSPLRWDSCENYVRLYARTQLPTCW